MNVFVPCMEWVPICWRKLLGLFSLNTEVDDLPDLPNSIIEDILSRLSPECIFQCQRDSKALQVLTKTQYFPRMQLDRSSPPPVIVVQCIPAYICDHGNIELYFIDTESSHDNRKIVIIDSCYNQKHDPILLVGSHDGFLLFTNKYKDLPVFYLWNPITNQKATFTPTDSRFIACGFYFCPLRKEYVLLFVSKDGAPFQFEIYNFGTGSREKAGKFSYPPSSDRTAVIVKKTLYWMVDQTSFKAATGDYPSHSHSVMSFQHETQKFETIGHDGFLGMSVIDRSEVHLFALEDELCICDSIRLKKLEISVLNHETKCWVKRYTVIIPTGEIYLFINSLDTFGNWENKLYMEVLGYRKGELLVRQKRRIFIYNVYSNTCRLVECKGLGCNNIQSIVHTDSLAFFKMDE